MKKILFILPEKKILYNNGKIEEVKRIYEFDNIEIRFAKPMIKNKNNINITTFVWTNRNVKLNNLTPRQLYEELMNHQYILFIDHDQRKIELLIDNGKTAEFPYDQIELIKDFFSKAGGILLENETFQYLELFSFDDEKVIYETVKRLEKKNFLKQISYSFLKIYEKIKNYC